ncbi:MAG TPA: hypothetical protein PKK96_03700 [Anaerolineales bacterium]|nr:hypothetical protein [Anaerolineales bacterium]HNQ96260.1 hypothetical protein [Anaerolineales bacterium]HNS60087.1 hypothetical protein [Anaerolineales bacterium]
MDEPSFTNPMDEGEGGGHGLIWLMLGVAAMGCGLLIAAGLFFFRADAQELYDQYFPSPTATRTNTPRPTATITPTPTLTPTPTPNLTAQAYEGTAVHAADAWTNLLTESFDSNQFGWHVGKDDDEYALTNFEVRDGKYIWDATAHQGFVQRIRANASAIKDFYFSVEITQPESLVDVDYGIYFREDQEDNYYYFGMDNNGEFILWLYNNEEWTQLVEETLSPAFQQGETNKLSMIAEENHFIFFINDEFAVECFDETLAAGNVGMVIEISQPNLHAIFEFDNVIVHLKK